MLIPAPPARVSPFKIPTFGAAVEVVRKGVSVVVVSMVVAVVACRTRSCRKVNVVTCTGGLVIALAVEVKVFVVLLAIAVVLCDVFCNVVSS